jgi:hypothetical protein
LFYLLTNIYFRIHQYKYRFDKWGWKKSLPSEKKTKILDIGRRRTQLGQSMALTFQGRPLDTKKLLRHAKKKEEVNKKLFSSAHDPGSSPFFMTSPLSGNRL